MNEEYKGLCFECKYAQYADDLEFYDIRCELNNKIYDENHFCSKFKFDPNHSKVNPRLYER